MAASRNIAEEQKALATFTRTYGKLPESPQEWAIANRLAYPTREQLPDELVRDVTDSTYAMSAADLVNQNAAATANKGGAALPPTQATQLAGYQSDLTAAGAERDKLGAQLQAHTTGAGSFFTTLQNAIRTKTGAAQTGIGESSLFKAAGIQGYDALMSSLATRGTELESSRADLQNVITGMGETFKAQASALKTGYDSAVDRYKFAAQQMDTILNDVKDHEQALQLLNIQNAAAKELELIQQRGQNVRAGIEQTDASKGIVGGFDIGVYATDPMHEQRVAGILANIGKFNTVEEVDAYIQRKYPNSPVTGAMISKASAQYGVPWEMLVAMMEQDSSLGTAGKAVRTRNPGNVGNDDSGNTRTYPTWDEGVAAVAQWLDRHRAAPSQAGTLKVLDDKQQQQVSTSEEAKKIVANRDFAQKLTVYEDLVSQFGFELTGQNAARLDSALAAVQVAYKNAAGLGALVGADFALIDRAIKPVTGPLNAPGYHAQGGRDGVLASLQLARNEITASQKAQRDTLLAKWPEYVDDPYLKSLLESNESPGVAVFSLSEASSAPVGSLIELENGKTVRKTGDNAFEDI